MGEAVKLRKVIGVAETQGEKREGWVCEFRSTWTALGSWGSTPSLRWPLSPSSVPTDGMPRQEQRCTPAAALLE